jgi:hypothetical protein
VYLFLVVEALHGDRPSAKIPTVLFPAAAPHREVAVDAPPALTAQPEYVYLLRVVDAQKPLTPVPPNAKIPNVPSSAAVMLLLNALIGEGP